MARITRIALRLAEGYLNQLAARCTYEHVLGGVPPGHDIALEDTLAYLVGPSLWDRYLLCPDPGPKR